MSYGRQTVERRQLGLILKRLREQKDASQSEAAQAMGKQQARISRAENGVGSLSQDDLINLLSFYDVTDDERETVLALGVETRKRQRGRTYTDLLPHSFERLADLQADAKAIGFYDTGIIPGPAQSPDYARELITACDGIWWESSEEEKEARLSFRLEQQHRVLEAQEPKHLHFVVTETALDQIVGSEAVMRGQMLHMLQLAERPNLIMLVLPNSVPNNPVLGGGLVTLEFGESAPRIAFASSVYGPCTYHDQEEDTGPMFCALDRARELSLTPQESTDLLLNKLKELHS